MKVLLTTNYPTPYMVDYLNELGTYCDVTAIFETAGSTIRNKEWDNHKFDNFKGIILHKNKINGGEKFSFNILKFLFKKFDRIIVCNMATQTGILFILGLRLLHKPYILQSEGGIQGSGKGIKEKFKYFLFHKAKYYLSGMNYEYDYFRPYGLTKETHCQYPFTSFKKSEVNTCCICKNKKEEIRKLLGIKEKKVIISVGNYIHRKGFDILVNSLINLDRDIGVYCVGGGQVDSSIQKIIKDNNLENIHFTGYKNKEELKKYYEAADLFVLATRIDTWGLVINEAMAYCLPVITTDYCVAGLELIKNGENGYIVPKENSSELAAAIDKIVNDDKLMKKMSINNLIKIQDYSIENMTEIIYKHLKRMNYE